MLHLEMSAEHGRLVQREYEKNAELDCQDILNIRHWLNEQPHLPHHYVTDLDLILAHFSCGFDVEKTKKVIDLNYTLRTMFTFYQDRIIDKSLENALHTWLITPLEPLTNKGHYAFYCQLLDPDPDKFVYLDVVRAFVMLMDLWLSEVGTAAGVSLIVNMENVSVAHLARIDHTVAREFFYFLQEAMFVRLKEFHFINAPSLIDTLMSIVRPFMKKEMLHLIKVHHTGSHTLDEFISISALPKDAGGENKEGTVVRDEVWNKMKSNAKFFEDESKKRVDESKRAGGPKTISSFFGSIEGSFKKLEID